MKRFFFIFLACLVLFTSFSFIVFSSDSYYFNFPEPVPDYRTFFFANDNYLFEFKFLGNGFTTADESFLNMTYYPYDIVISANSNNTFNFYAYNYTFENVKVVAIVYDRQGDVYGNPLTISLNSAGYISSQTGNEIDPDIKYVRSSNRVNVPLHSFNCRWDNNFEIDHIANILWNDDLNIHNDFVASQTILNTIATGIGTIITQDSSYYSLVDQFIDDFFNTSWEDLPASADNTWQNWSYMLWLIENNTGMINNFQLNFLGWYHQQWQPYTEEELSLLHDILNNIATSEEVTTSVIQSEVHSQVDIYESQEANIMNEAGSHLDNASNVLNNWNIDLSDSSDAFEFIRNVFFNFVERYFSIFLIIPLVFGLIVLVLGRRVQR